MSIHMANVTNQSSISYCAKIPAVVGALLLTTGIALFIINSVSNINFHTGALAITSTGGAIFVVSAIVICYKYSEKKSPPQSHKDMILFLLNQEKIALSEEDREDEISYLIEMTQGHSFETIHRSFLEAKKIASLEKRDLVYTDVVAAVQQLPKIESDPGEA